MVLTGVLLGVLLCILFIQVVVCNAVGAGVIVLQ
jgi:hypothetical protein